ncbi:hypothetical protein C5E02_03750 [Rathayibacter rathayi]|uniref:Uncharacterized protein n=1 Tax=Rathayibacter rathayi TaxID=33887 RepID=A0ABX5AGN1_RATRA|nr:hypothetical protein C1O28_03950 [Rathayibacter rathayi]PPF50095.1 hypothetical protein C5C08_05985 [Rathayibacter rathayi]PPG70084.1 hypothetical protein C5C16_04920 [Rathayibacter rathayi]PPG79739.1 hypothetical protein C5C15_05475 [Rathayibacter rathayi]PPH38045.1 hypothetical protein C5C28_02865 [Rathayibacter rathayi]
MQGAHEHVAEEVSENEPPRDDILQERRTDLDAYRLLCFIEFDLHRPAAEDLTRLRREGVSLVRLQRGLAIAWLDGHRVRCVRAARNRSTRSVRFAPTGTDRFSRAAEAWVDRRAARRSASSVTFLRSMCLPPVDS